MSATDEPETGDLSSAPEFELECAYDDPEDPSELTIFAPSTPRSVTEWVTADRSAAVPLDRIR